MYILHNLDDNRSIEHYSKVDKNIIGKGKSVNMKIALKVLSIKIDEKKQFYTTDQ